MESGIILLQINNFKMEKWPWYLGPGMLASLAWRRKQSPHQSAEFRGSSKSCSKAMWSRDVVCRPRVYCRRPQAKSPLPCCFGAQETGVVGCQGRSWSSIRMRDYPALGGHPAQSTECGAKKQNEFIRVPTERERCCTSPRVRPQPQHPALAGPGRPVRRLRMRTPPPCMAAPGPRRLHRAGLGPPRTRTPPPAATRDCPGARIPHPQPPGTRASRTHLGAAPAAAAPVRARRLGARRQAARAAPRAHRWPRLAPSAERLDRRPPAPGCFAGLRGLPRS